MRQQIGFSILINVAGMMLIGCPQDTSIAPGERYNFAGTDWQRGHRIAQTPDGGFFISGDAVYAGQATQVLALKLNSSLNATWVSGDDVPFSDSFSQFSGLAIYTDNREVALVGVDVPTSNSRITESHLRVVRVNENGDIASDNIYGEQTFAPTSVFQLPEGDLGIGAFMFSRGNSKGSHYLRLSSDGSFIENTELNSNLIRTLTSIVTSTGEIVFAGRGGIPDVSDSIELVITKVTIDGVEHWTQVIDVNGRDNFHGIAEASNGDFVLAGESPNRVSVVRIDSAGNLIWARDDILPPNGYNESDEVWDVDVTHEGNIVIVGKERDVRTAIPPLQYTVTTNFIALLNSQGDLIWRTVLGDAEVYGVTTTAEGTFMATGSLGNDLVVIEVDANGNILN